MVLNEGGTATITHTELPVVDQDNQNDQLTDRVDSLPGKWTLLKNGIPLSVGSVFSQDDILAGKITYRHTRASSRRMPATASRSFCVTAPEARSTRSSSRSPYATSTRRSPSPGRRRRYPSVSVARRRLFGAQPWLD
ncbi:MAG: cadherin-like domain-containing protein [Candidatus Accumulibacter phosphatis]